MLKRIEIELTIEIKNDIISNLFFLIFLFLHSFLKNINFLIKIFFDLCYVLYMFYINLWKLIEFILIYYFLIKLSRY